MDISSRSRKNRFLPSFWSPAGSDWSVCKKKTPPSAPSSSRQDMTEKPYYRRPPGGVLVRCLNLNWLIWTGWYEGGAALLWVPLKWPSSSPYLQGRAQPCSKGNLLLPVVSATSFFRSLNRASKPKSWARGSRTWLHKLMFNGHLLYTVCGSEGFSSEYPELN